MIRIGRTLLEAFSAKIANKIHHYLKSIRGRALEDWKKQCQSLGIPTDKRHTLPMTRYLCQETKITLKTKTGVLEMGSNDQHV